MRVTAFDECSPIALNKSNMLKTRFVLFKIA